VSISWARQAQTIAGADLLILPGSKHVAEDLSWLRQTGLDTAISAHVEANKPMLAICGGLQMLGHELLDPHGAEGEGVGFGLLPYSTEYGASKLYQHGSYTLSALTGFWARLSGVHFGGYEIRHGRTCPIPSVKQEPPLCPALPANGGWQCGETLALYTHGLFENSAVMHALFSERTPTLDDTLNSLAGFVDAHIGSQALLSLLRQPRRCG